MALVDAADGTASAQYEYGPFGETIRLTGPMAKANPFRFSTKYQDEETGWNYYGHRFLDSNIGRWLSRDPIGENGASNLYVTCGNNTLNSIDILGCIWLTNRNSSFSRGTARPTSPGDTFDDLAKLIGLDTQDYRAWLQTQDPTPVRCKVYSIPNTI